MDSFFDWAFQLWPAWLQWLIIPWAYLAIGVGSIHLILISVMAISHYGFGMPIYDQKTGKPATRTQTLMTFLLFAGSGAFFAVLGVLVHRWKSA